MKAIKQLSLVGDALAGDVAGWDVVNSFVGAPEWCNSLIHEFFKVEVASIALRDCPVHLQWSKVSVTTS